MNLAIILQVAQFLVWLILKLPELVKAAEEMIPESGQGARKFQAVKDAVVIAAQVAGVADKALAVVTPMIDGKINDAVAKTVNVGK